MFFQERSSLTEHEATKKQFLSWTQPLPLTQSHLVSHSCPHSYIIREKTVALAQFIHQVSSQHHSCRLLIATNSSSLRSSQMLANTKRNYRICNGHYYMPPEQLYFELMSCGHTDPDIFPFLMEKAATAGFKPVHVQKDSTGLIFNRIWAGIKRECLLVLADGVTDGATIDEMFKSWFAANKGPCQMMDAIGLDTVYNIEVVYNKELHTNPRAKDWLKTTCVDKGNLGAKAGKGLLG